MPTAARRSRTPQISADDIGLTGVAGSLELDQMHFVAGDFAGHWMNGDPDVLRIANIGLLQA